MRFPTPPEMPSEMRARYRLDAESERVKQSCAVRFEIAVDWQGRAWLFFGPRARGPFASLEECLKTFGLVPADLVPCEGHLAH
jgi:hypothetical protein